MADLGESDHLKGSSNLGEAFLLGYFGKLGYRSCHSSYSPSQQPADSPGWYPGLPVTGIDFDEGRQLSRKALQKKFIETFAMFFFIVSRFNKDILDLLIPFLVCNRSIKRITVAGLGFTGKRLQQILSFLVPFKLFITTLLSFSGFMILDRPESIILDSHLFLPWFT
jgi:hypothetical protein